MKKFTGCLAMLALLAVVPAATAADINLWFCVEPPSYSSSCAACTAGNPTLYISPAPGGCPSLAPYNTGKLTLKMDVATLGDGCGSEIVSALGLNVTGTNVSTGFSWGLGSASLTCSDFVFFNSPATTGATNAPWSGVKDVGVEGAAPSLVTDARAVAVPDSSGSALWNGFCPGGSYRVAQLTLSAGNNANPNGQTNYAINMSVGDLKITKLYDPASTQGPAVSTVAFGYDGVNPDQSAGDGSTPGSSTAIADATVIIRKKGDFSSFNGVSVVAIPDGIVNSNDVAAFANTVFNGPANDLERYLGDFSRFNGVSVVPEPDCIVNSNDVTAFADTVFNASCSS